MTHDKAKVESGVLVVERWIMAALRKRKFFSLSEVNQAVAELLTGLNNRPFRKAAGTRRSLFEALDKPALRPLPAERYQYGDWATARVNIDYHVVADSHFYSVPYRLVHEPVEVRLSASTVEVFHKGVRVASHARSHAANKASTLDEHRPKSHQRYLQWTPSRLVEWGRKIGPAYRRVAGAHPRLQAASRAGIPYMPGRHPTRRRVRSPTAGSRCPAGVATPDLFLQERRIHAEVQSRHSAGSRGPAPATATRSPEHPRAKVFRSTTTQSAA